MNQLENRSTKNQQLSTVGEFANFKIIHEDWDLHKLEDNSLLRARVFLTGVLQEKESLSKIIEQLKAGQKPELSMILRTKHHFEVESPPSLRGLSDSKTYPINELRLCVVDEDIDFKTTRQSWNIYELENGIKIKLRVSVTSVSRTSKFDSYGMPIYIIDLNIEGKTELPKSVQKLVKQKQLKMNVKTQKIER
jgi:hypothetical protein